MKISEVTQKSHSEQLSEDRSKLDEAFWVPFTAAAGAGLSYADLGSRFGWKPWEWTKAQWKTAGAEIAAREPLRPAVPQRHKKRLIRPWTRQQIQMYNYLLENKPN